MEPSLLVSNHENNTLGKTLDAMSFRTNSDYFFLIRIVLAVLPKKTLKRKTLASKHILLNNIILTLNTLLHNLLEFHRYVKYFSSINLSSNQRILLTQRSYIIISLRRIFFFGNCRLQCRVEPYNPSKEPCVQPSTSNHMLRLSVPLCRSFHWIEDWIIILRRARGENSQIDILSIVKINSQLKFL